MAAMYLSDIVKVVFGSYLFVWKFDTSPMFSGLIKNIRGLSYRKGDF